MKDERKKILARREAKKMKEQMKKGRINLNSLQLEACGFQFRFINQPPWNQLIPRATEPNSDTSNNRVLQHKQQKVIG